MIAKGGATKKKVQVLVLDLIMVRDGERIHNGDIFEPLIKFIMLNFFYLMNCNATCGILEQEDDWNNESEEGAI